MGRDQHEIAARIEYHGIGIRIKMDAGRRDISHALNRLPADSRFAQRASSMCVHVREEAASGALMNWIESATGSTSASRSVAVRA